MKFPEPEANPEAKRPRDEATDAFIREMLEQEQSGKKRAKQTDGKPVKRSDKKTLAEVEAEEGGPVKVSQVAMAHTRRALGRKAAKGAEDTDLPDDVEGYEEELQVADKADDHGVELEPFNLKQERERGYFDEAGNYVERKDDDEGLKDAWLDSVENATVSDKVRKLLEEREKAAAEADQKAPLTERQIAERRAEMASYMQDGETVTTALKRLGAQTGQHRAMGKREKARLLAQAQQQGGAAGADATAFARLTELANELLEEGEMDIYSENKRQLERSAAMWLPAQPKAPQAKLQAAASKAAAGDDDFDMFGDAEAADKSGVPGAAAGADDDDMFADDDNAGVAKPKPGSKSASGQGEEKDMFGDGDDDMFADKDDVLDQGAPVPAGESAQAAEPASAVAAQPDAALSNVASHTDSSVTTGRALAGTSDEGTDFSSWPVKELKRFLEERGVDPSGFVEKADLVAKVQEVAAQGPATDPFVAPPGYVFDPSTGYFYSSESDLYYDGKTGGYYHASTGKWYTYDASIGQFVEWTGS